MNPSWRRYLLIWGARVEHDVDDELTFHHDMLMRDNLARGMSPDEARRAAERRLGNLSGMRSACLTIGQRRQRRMARAQTIDALHQDIRYALRTLGRAKAWTAVALLTLALGIGASTAMFSVLNSLILNPLPYRDPGQVATLWRSAPSGVGVMFTARAPMVDAWRKNAHSIESFESFSKRPVELSTGDASTELVGGLIRPTFPAFTGTSLIAGRVFNDDEMRVGGPRAVILGEGLWRDRFAGARDVIGKTVALNDTTYTIIGVAPAKMRLPGLTRHPNLWLPLVSDTGRFPSSAMVRVRKGISFESAAAELDSIVDRAGLREPFGSGFITKLARPQDFVDFRSSLYLLTGAVALLLVVACANVAHLSLARGATRTRELAIRAALGAGRMRLLRQLLTESLLLSLVGGVFGVGIAFVALKILVVVRPERLSLVSSASIDSTALWMSLALSVLTGVTFGITAALESVRRSTNESLRNSAVAAGTSRQTHRLRAALVITEMALSSMLLVTAALLVRSVINLRSADPGFAVANLYSAKVDFPNRRYDDKARRAFMTDLQQRASVIPGLQSSSLAHGTPLDADVMMGDLTVQGIAQPVAHGATAVVSVDTNYFRTMGIKLIDGTGFTAGGSARDLIINQSFAKAILPNHSAVGQRIRVGQNSKAEWMTVVGVVNDVARGSLRGDRHRPMLYEPQNPNDDYPPSTLLIRTAPGDNPSDALRKLAKSIDPKLPLLSIETAAASMAETVATDSFTMQLIMVFAGLAVVLSAIGLYGMISYGVTQRMREIGIRIALGATARDVATSIVGRGLLLSSIGLAIGLVVSLWGTKLVRSTLYGVDSTDATSFVATVAVLLIVSTIACLRPTWRALSIDPAIAMRGD